MDQESKCAKKLITHTHTHTHTHTQPFTPPDYPTKQAPSPATSKSTSANTNKTSAPSEDKPASTKKPKNSSSSSNKDVPNSPNPPDSVKPRRSSEEEDVTKKKKGNGTPLPVPRAPSVFTFDKVEGGGSDTPSGGRNGTLDDLCRAAELLDSMDGSGSGADKDSSPQPDEGELDENGRRRPKNITIPQSHSTPVIERDKIRLGATPPYTPPPILSPSRSLSLLSGPAPGTPCRILSHWSSRRSSDGHALSESEDNYNEPRINVGKDFQAELPECKGEYCTNVLGSGMVFFIIGKQIVCSFNIVSMYTVVSTL